MMRGRVIAQGATVVMLSAYAGYDALGGFETIKSKFAEAKNESKAKQNEKDE